jgi:hypothetical protein
LGLVGECCLKRSVLRKVAEQGSLFQQATGNMAMLRTYCFRVGEKEREIFRVGEKEREKEIFNRSESRISHQMLGIAKGTS